MEARLGRHQQLKLLAASLAEVPPPQPPFKVVPLVGWRASPCPQGRGSPVSSPGAARTSPAFPSWRLAPLGAAGRAWGQLPALLEGEGESWVPPAPHPKIPHLSATDGECREGEFAGRKSKLLSAARGPADPAISLQTPQRPPKPQLGERPPQLQQDTPTQRPARRAAQLQTPKPSGDPLLKYQRRGTRNEGLPWGHAPHPTAPAGTPLSYLSCPPRSAPARPAAGCGQGSGSPSAAGASGSSCRGSGAPKLRGSEAPGLPSSEDPKLQGSPLCRPRTGGSAPGAGQGWEAGEGMLTSSSSSSSSPPRPLAPLHQLGFAPRPALQGGSGQWEPVASRGPRGRDRDRDRGLCRKRCLSCWFQGEKTFRQVWNHILPVLWCGSTARAFSNRARAYLRARGVRARIIAGTGDVQPRRAAAGAGEDVHGGCTPSPKGSRVLG